MTQFQYMEVRVALNMLDAMVQELRDEDQNASHDKIELYKKRWQRIEANNNELKEWPCPRCFAKGNPVTGKLILIDRYDGVESATCNRCGPLLTEFKVTG